MKTLSDFTVEEMVSGKWDLRCRAGEPLAFELQFTECYRSRISAAIEDRELACLRVEFPSRLEPIGDDDLLAGRVLCPLVGFSPEAGGLGYYCREQDIQTVLARKSCSHSHRARVLDMLEFWRNESTAARVRAAYPNWIKEALPSDNWTEDSGVAFPLYRMAGVQLDYSLLLELGIPGLRKRIESRIQSDGDSSVGRFGRALAAAVDLLADCCRFYANQARARAARSPDGDGGGLSEMASVLDALCEGPPGCLREAIQLMWLFAVISGTWNYGRMDVYFGPYLDRDLRAGILSQDQALELIQSLWRLMKAYDNCFNNRVIVGGKGRPDEPAADQFALLAMEAQRRLRLDQPQLSLRFYQGQNPELMDKALALLGEGCTFPILYNDDVNVAAVRSAFGVGELEALEYIPFGCGEYVLSHRSVGSPNGVINLLKCLELALHDGVDPVTGRQAGPRTGDLDSLSTFEHVWKAYATQVQAAMAALAAQEKIEYDVVGQTAPFLLLSLLFDDCLTRGRPIFAGGARYLGGIVETYGNTNTADSLNAIDQVVFRRRTVSLRALVEACGQNFQRTQELQNVLTAVPKYGNDDDAADAMAVRVHQHVCTSAQQLAEKNRLHSYLVVVINNWANVILGRKTGPSADGRLSGEPMANGNNPVAGADQSGVTALLNSLVKLDPTIHAGTVQNIKLSRRLFKEELPKLRALFDTYWSKGGTQAMLTVVGREDLEAAMREPEKWGFLMVRVGGFSARFIDLPREVQLELLNRTLHE